MLYYYLLSFIMLTEESSAFIFATFKSRGDAYKGKDKINPFRIHSEFEVEYNSTDSEFESDN